MKQLKLALSQEINSFGDYLTTKVGELSPCRRKTLSPREKLSLPIENTSSGVYLITPTDDLTPILVDPDYDCISVDNRTNSAILILDSVTNGKTLLISLLQREGQSVEIRFTSGGNIKLDSSEPVITLLYLGEQWFTISTSPKSVYNKK